MSTNTYPVEVGQTYMVKNPLDGSTRPVVCTVPGPKGFKGTNQAGKEITVRSYRLVEGMQDYVAPEVPKAPPAFTAVVGDTYVVNTPQGERAFECKERLSDIQWLGVGNGTGTRKLWDRAIVREGTVVMSPQPKATTAAPKRRRAFGTREVSFERDDKQYFIKWGEHKVELLDADGKVLFDMAHVPSIFNAIEELQP